MASGFPILHLHRDAQRADRTLGRLTVYDAGGVAVYQCETLELPWRANRRGVSCIPNGAYRVAHRRSARYGAHLDVLGEEPARSAVLLHAGNYPRHTRGCILPGVGRHDLDGDGALDVARSREALDQLRVLVPREGGRLLVTSARALA
jgi:hypothetical protein